MSTPLAPPKGRGPPYMSQLTLAWAVNQSRRVFRAKKKQVHPEDVSSAGTDGGGSSYHGSPAKSRGGPIGNQRRAKAKPGCLGALMALMGFGRGGSKVRGAARQMRQRRAGDPNNRPPGSPGFGPPASPLSRGGLLSSGGSSSRSVFKSPVSPSPMPRPELDTAGHRPRSTGGLDGRAASRDRRRSTWRAAWGTGTRMNSRLARRILENSRPTSEDRGWVPPRRLRPSRAGSRSSTRRHTWTMIRRRGSGRRDGPRPWETRRGPNRANRDSHRI